MMYHSSIARNPEKPSGAAVQMTEINASFYEPTEPMFQWFSRLIP